MGLPTQRLYGPILASGGETNCYFLQAPVRGRVHSVIVNQQSGSNDGYTVDLFHSSTPCPVSPEGSLSEAQLFGDENLFKILPTMVADPGESALEYFSEVGHAYVNNDGGFANPKYEIYLRIRPGGSPNSEKEFTLGITYTKPGW